MLADVTVGEAIRGEGGTLVAFDYDLGGGAAGGTITSRGGAISSVPGGSDWVVGQDVLLFLAPSTGTVHEGLRPEHWQVVGGTQGRYLVVVGSVQAPFTLDQVRATSHPGRV